MKFINPELKILKDRLNMLKSNLHSETIPKLDKVINKEKVSDLNIAIDIVKQQIKRYENKLL